MKYEINNKIYDVDIIRKNNRNTYIRVKNGIIIVTTNRLTPLFEIKRLMDNNRGSVMRMINHDNTRQSKEDDFYFLGHKYDIIVMPNLEDVIIEDDKIYTRDDKMLSYWLKREIKALFNARYLYLLNEFSESDKHYTLKYRKMSTRWGVNNRKSKTITLNTNLIKYDISCLDYVIIHELCHLVYFDHSKSFWNLVAKYVPNYKEIKKELKE